MPVETIWTPSPSEQALIGTLNKYQDVNDLRPSEMASLLIGLAGYFAPTDGVEVMARLTGEWHAHLAQRKQSKQS